MKIFAAGIITETNTFCPIPTALEDFDIGRADEAGTRMSTWRAQAAERRDSITFGLMAWANPGGITVRSAYESLRDELLERLRAAGPQDVVLLNLHGAMIADGYPDCEEDIIRRVRDLTGRETVIGVELDLHCHLTENKIAAADLVVIYKEYPHTDINDRARELFDLAVATHQGRIRPTLALFDCRMIGSYPTSRQPLRGLVDEMMAAEGRDGLLSISFGHDFRCADLPNLSSKMLVVTNGDKSKAERIAREFGLKAYGMRRKIGFDTVSLPLEEALSRALASTKTPVVVADQSDNPGGGAPSDSTFALRWLLDHGAGSIGMGIFCDPEVVRIAKKAGVGATLPVRLGGKMGPASGDPVDIDVTVLALRENYWHAWPQQSGEPILNLAGDVVALRTAGIDILVSIERCHCVAPSIFFDLGIDPRAKRILVPKSNQHFYAEFAKIAGEILYMAGPGAVPPDPRRIGYQRLDKSRLYPWVDDPLGVESA